MDDKARPITIGAYEAKTKFSELLARTERGESFLVTKNGRPVAQIAPVGGFDRERARRAADHIRALAATVDLGDLSWDQIKAWRDEGRP